MSWNRIAAVTLLVMPLGLASCAGDRIPPKALVDARADFALARYGAAARLDPTDVHESAVALQRAERAWANAPEDPTTLDLAVIADRRALLAQSVALTLSSRHESREVTARLEEWKARQLEATEGQLSQSQQDLGVTQMQLQQQEASARAQQQRIDALQAKLDDARESIARIASVKDDERGMVITLPSEVLFTTGKYDLKPGAMARLDEIAAALQSQERPVVVLGYTDNVGTRDMNLRLSQGRAQTVRDYLVRKGVPEDLVTAQGKGPDDPLADNVSTEGRAQNRRVEIVLQPRK